MQWLILLALKASPGPVKEKLSRDGEELKEAQLNYAVESPVLRLRKRSKGCRGCRGAEA